jgi:hypothetical protein
VSRLSKLQPRRSARHLGFACSLLLLCAVPACHAPKTESCSCRPCEELKEAGVPVDPTLLSFLSRARAAHHIADGLEQGQPPLLDGAIARLTQVADGPLPSNAESSPEIREVLADTLARVADLQTRVGKLDDARRTVARGLRQVPEISYYRGHLYEVLGIVEEREHQLLTLRNDQLGAANAAERALLALDEAMRIQAEVIAQASPATSHQPPTGSLPQKTP